ncbi:hypothetical protein PILCRDRAFT_816667, partial [Piloderma croceum F 1598]
MSPTCRRIDLRTDLLGGIVDHSNAGTIFTCVINGRWSVQSLVRQEVSGSYKARNAPRICIPPD